MKLDIGDLSPLTVQSSSMIVCLLGTAIMPHMERRIGLAKTGILGLR